MFNRIIPKSVPWKAVEIKSDAEKDSIAAAVRDAEKARDAEAAAYSAKITASWNETINELETQLSEYKDTMSLMGKEIPFDIGISIYYIAMYKYKRKQDKEAEIPELVRVIGDGTFENMDRLEKVIMPNYLHSIGDRAFRNCDKLKEITLPESLRLIGGNAFRNCESLTKLEVPYLVGYIGENAFEMCSSLKEFKIPSTVRYIGSSAFSECNDIVRFDLPESLETLGDNVFDYCYSLKEITVPLRFKDNNSIKSLEFICKIKYI